MTKGNNKNKSSSKNLRFLDQFGQPAIFNIGGEESFKTNLGVLWTIILLFVLIYAMIYYFLNYINFKNPDVTTQTLRLDTFPKINLGEHDFFVSFVYRDDNKEVVIKDFQITWFIVEAFQVTIQKTGGNEKPTVSRSQIPILFCGDAKIDETDLKGERSVALNVNASCINFDNNAVLEGGPGSDVFKFVEVIVRPCDETDTRCKTYGIEIDDTIGTNPALKLASKRVRAVTLQFNFFEAGIQVENAEKPLMKNINSNYELRMDVFQEKYRSFFFQKFSIVDVRGILSDEEKRKESLTLSDVLTETTTRIPGRKDIEFKLSSGSETRSANYMTIRLQASNTEYIITRSYKKLIDVFADVGGIAEIVTFVIGILYSWHNSIRMEQNMINNGVLNGDEQAKQVGREGFSYSELFCFGLCGCCSKKKSKKGRKEFYEECKGTLENRLDILNFLKTQGKVGIIQSALLEPYQIKLLSLAVSEKSKTDLSKKYEEAHALSIKEAIEKLNEDGKKNGVTKMVDKWILENMNNEIRNKYGTVSITSLEQERVGFNEDDMEERAGLSKRQFSKVSDSKKAFNSRKRINE